MSCIEACIVHQSGVRFVKVPGSVFIMDVSQSSSISPPTKLTQYLRDMVTWLRTISKLNPQAIALTHRFGDEVLFVARGFETAYLFAFYITMTWPFAKQPPYFGVAYGDLLTDVPASEDLETWNSPIVKWARVAADELKREKSAHRKWLLFGNEGGADQAVSEILNEYALIQDRFFKLQTEAEYLASALYAINGIQEWVARELEKNPSTISLQIRKSNVDVLLATKNRVVKTLHERMLSQLQNTDTEGERDPRGLEAQIQNELKKHVKMFLSYTVTVKWDK